MERLPKDKREHVRPLFDGFPAVHGAVDAAIEGSLGDVFVNDPAHPTVARIVLGDFSLIAGDPDAPAAAAALLAVPDHDYLAVGESWADTVGGSLPNAFPNDRFAFRAPERWDRAALAKMRESLPPEFRLQRVDASTVTGFREMNHTFVDNFASPEDFLARGVGFGVTHDGRFVAGCSSYSISSSKLEFEIETRRAYQRRGLALVTGSAVIEYCLENGLEPCWDAAHEGSALLAARLGFVDRQRYTAYRIGIPAGPPPGV